MYKHFFKRFFDILLSFIALVLLSPVLIVMTIVGAVVMRGNPFFAQIRPGKIDSKTGTEKLFKLIKFRSMTNKKDREGKLLPDDQRLTKYGEFIRKTSLDEIPEFAMVLIGTMSLVGPRPQLVRDMVFMSDEQRRRHTVRPGITGLAQISGRNEIDWEDKLNYDVEYVKRVKLSLDIKILFRTVFKVAQSEGISAEGMATAEDYGDYLLRRGRVTAEEYDRKQEEAKKYVEYGIC